MCEDFIFASNEILISTVSRDIWPEMHRIAREEDINKDGYYDERWGGAINIWCGPDNKPEGYNYKITKGGLNFPRNFMASIYGYPDYTKIKLFLVVKNFAAELIIIGAIKKSEKKSDLIKAKKLLNGTLEDIDWSIKMTKELIKKAEQKILEKKNKEGVEENE